MSKKSPSRTDAFISLFLWTRKTTAMTDRKKTPSAKRSTAVLLAVLLAASTFLMAFFAVKLNQTKNELADLRTGYASESETKQAEIDRLTKENATFKEDIAALEADVADLQARLDAKTLTGLDPDHPSYMDKYPDFYAPQPLKADYAPDKTVYLTFDDGPSVVTTSILETLAAYDVKATFFIVTMSGYSREGLKAIADAGHTVAMHSKTHSYNTIYASVDAFLDDMYAVFTEIRDVTGITPTLFRFPGGSINSYNHLVYQEIIAEMLRRGFIPFDWNVSSGDASANTVAKDAIVNNVLATTTMSRAIVLMHDGYYKTTTAEALPEIIEGLRAKGYRFEALQPNSKPVLFQYIDSVKQNP